MHGKPQDFGLVRELSAEFRPTMVNVARFKLAPLIYPCGHMFRLGLG